MTALTAPFVVIGVAVTVPVFAFGVRRLLGLRVSPLRWVIGGIVALAFASPIITAIGGSIVKRNGSWPFLPAVWFVILGVAIALLLGMLVLVIFEALVPSGTMPGPLYLIRGLRKRARRVRRYSQITRILVRRGMRPTCGALAAPNSRPTTAAPNSRARSDSRSRMAASRSSSSDRYWRPGGTYCRPSSSTSSADCRTTPRRSRGWRSSRC